MPTKNASQRSVRVVRTQRVNPPAVEFRRREKKGGFVVTERLQPIPHGGDCSAHGAFWPVFLDAESRSPLCPFELADEMLSGAAVFADRDAAHANVGALKADGLVALHRIPVPGEREMNEAIDPGGAQDPTHVGQFVQAYRNVLSAADAFTHRTAVEKLLGYMGLEPGDDVPPSASGESVRLLTAEEVADLFRLEVHTLHGKDRPSFLPAPLRLGKRLLWRSDVVLALLNQGGPRLAAVPSIPQENAR